MSTSVDGSRYSVQGTWDVKDPETHSVYVPQVLTFGSHSLFVVCLLNNFQGIWFYFQNRSMEKGVWTHLIPVPEVTTACFNPPDHDVTEEKSVCPLYRWGDWARGGW